MEKLVEQYSIIQSGLRIPLALYDEERNWHYPVHQKRWFEATAPIAQFLEVSERVALIKGRLEEAYILLLLEQPVRLVLGPLIFSEEMQRVTLKKILQNANVLLEKQYYESVGVYSTREVRSMLLILARLFDVELPSKWEWLDNYVIDTGIKKQQEMSEAEHYPHSSYLNEAKFYEAIRAGNTDEIVMKLQEFYNSGALGKLSSNRLRNEKNLVISGITLASRAAIEGGMDEKEAYMLSDQFIEKMEELGDVQAIHGLYINAVTVFAQRVKRTKIYGSYSPVVARVIRLLLSNNKLSLAEIAAQLKLSTFYISRIFKNELGESFSSYKRKVVLEHAVALLVNSDLTISEIALEADFNDVSYFSKVFKEQFNLSPLDYRKRMRELK